MRTTRALGSAAVAMLVSLVLAEGAAAALLSRLGGLAVYDDVQDVTWIASANLAATDAFGVAGITSTGTMSWGTAKLWIDALNDARYLGASDWRLPEIVDTGTPFCDASFSGTDCGFNVELAGSEMAHLFAATLGNFGAFDTSGAPTGCGNGGAQPSCLVNAGPFSGIANGTSDFYWSSTPVPGFPSGIFGFNFHRGEQYPVDSFRPDVAHAWAVRSGDIAALPTPAPASLLAASAALLGFARRRRALRA